MGSTPTTAAGHEPGPGPEAQAPRLLGGGDQNQGGAVGNLAGVAGGHHPVRFERRLEGGHLLQARLPPGALVGLQDLGGLLVGGGHGQRDQLPGEAALVGGPDGPLVALVGVGVQLLPAQLPLLGDQLRRDPLGDQSEPLLEGRAHRPAIRAHLHPAHALHPAGDEELVVPGPDGLGGPVEGFQAGGAHAVDGDARNLHGPARGQNAHPRDVQPLLPHVGDATQEQILHLKGIQVVPVRQGVEEVGHQLLGVEPAHPPPPPADGGPHRVDDPRLAHGRALPS